MPHLNLVTNVKNSDAKAFVLEFSKRATEILGKPEKSVSINYTYSETMSFGGTFEPAFQLIVMSLGNLNVKANAVYTKHLFEFLVEKLGVSDDRGYIVFNDPGLEYSGHRGKLAIDLVVAK